MLPYILFIASLILSFKRPLAGFAIFLVSQTALGGIVTFIFPQLPWQYGLWSVSIAIVVLWSKRSPQRKYELSGVIFLSLSLFTCLVFIRQLIVPLGLDWRLIITRTIPYALLWAPLYGAFISLDDCEHEKLLHIIALIGGAIGVCGVIAFMSGNSTLLNIFNYGQLDVQFKGLTSQEDLLKNRYLISGVFTFIPMAFWVVIYFMFSPGTRSITRSIAYGASAALMFAVMAISLTRSLIINTIIGIMILLWRLFRMKNRNQVKTLMTIVILIFVAASVFSYMGMDKIVSALSTRMDTLILYKNQDTSIATRLRDSEMAFSYISDNMLLFGADGPDPLANYEHLGDPALPLYVWIWYGFFGVIFFYYVMMAILWRLYSDVLFAALNHNEYILVSSLCAWSIIYIYQTLTGSYLGECEVFMLILFISEIARLYRKVSKGRYTDEPLALQGFA